MGRKIGRKIGCVTNIYNLTGDYRLPVQRSRMKTKIHGFKFLIYYHFELQIHQARFSHISTSNIIVISFNFTNQYSIVNCESQAGTCFTDALSRSLIVLVLQYRNIS